MPTNQTHQSSALGTPSSLSPPDAGQWVSVCKHLLCLVFPLTTLSFLLTGLYVYESPLSVLNVLGFTLPFWVILLLDWWCPNEKYPAGSRHSALFFDGILGLLTLIQISNILLMLDFIALLRWDTNENIVAGAVNLVGIRFLVGTSSGTSGIVLAHELIHRPQRLWQWTGRLLLCTVCYEHFTLAHKRGHHLSLGMPDDISTARFGESFKEYWRRICPGYFRYAWRSERERTGFGRNARAWLENEVLQGLTMEAALILMIWLYSGWLALAMFLYQAWIAVRILEAVNYFQHWGLENGRFGNTFGWVCPSWVSRYVLIGLSHHIGHHLDETASFYQIAYSDRGPKLPYGYFVMNLWVKLFNRSYQKMATSELLKFQKLSTP